VRVDRARCCQFRLDLFGQLFAEFDPHLVVGVDVPDCPLDKNLVFVKGDKASEGLRVKTLDEEGIGGAVAREGLVGNQFLQGLSLKAFLREFNSGLFLGFAFHQGLSLSEKVGQKNVVMPPERIKRFNRGQKVAGDQLRSLMNQLIKGMLTVGARFPPDDWASAPRNGFPFSIHALAVAFHIALLKVSREAVKILIVGKDGVRLGIVKVVVPDAKESKGHRQVLLNGGLEEMFVHGVGALEKFCKPLIADREGNAQTDGRPERVAPADPVPKGEHIRRIDAELDDFALIGGKGNEMLRDMFFLDRLLKKPGTGRVGVGQGFLSGKGLGSYKKEGGRGVAYAECFSQMG